MTASGKSCAIVCFALLLVCWFGQAQARDDSDIGHLLSKGGTEVGFNVGGGLGAEIFGTELHHDFALGGVHLGRVLSDNWCRGHWYEGNWEAVGELFGGYQINPRGAYLVGIAPFIRYNIVAHSPWVPFAEVGAGIAFTDISGPELSSRFNFNVQGGVGLHRFLSRNLAFTVQGRLLHISNANTDDPNIGVNTVVVLLGFNWFM